MPRSRFFRYDEEHDEVVEVDRPMIHNRPHYPFRCEALGVHPEQIGEFREFDKQMGVSTEYSEDGCPIIEDAAHYRRYRRAHQVHFNNGYES